MEKVKPFFRMLAKGVLSAFLVSGLIAASYASSVVFSIGSSAYGKELFEKYEIRVIRPRYFTKRKKFELGVSGNVIMNQPFIYTYSGSASLGFHFTEQFGLELAGTYGFSIDKEDKEILHSETFRIETQILRTQYELSGALQYTPIYGKYQLSSGRLIYFDTYFTAGYGLSGIEYRYEQCETDEKPRPQGRVVSYGSFLFGAGQRYFISKKTSIKWGVRASTFSYDIADGGCEGSASEESTQYNVTMHTGISRFF